ncbi:MAG: hypothetical protein H6849_03625 [Alphaproteobacteria bacterium]|nr:MAG: hypothetical protein H6849_03625 [Alphaproteobacteria bacterium]
MIYFFLSTVSLLQVSVIDEGVPRDDGRPVVERRIPLAVPDRPVDNDLNRAQLASRKDRKREARRDGGIFITREQPSSRGEAPRSGGGLARKNALWRSLPSSHMRPPSAISFRDGLTVVEGDIDTTVLASHSQRGKRGRRRKIPNPIRIFHSSLFASGAGGNMGKALIPRGTSVGQLRKKPTSGQIIPVVGGAGADYAIGHDLKQRLQKKERTRQKKSKKK